MLDQTLDQFTKTLISRAEHRHKLDPSIPPEKHGLNFAQQVFENTCSVSEMLSSSDCRSGCGHCCTLYVSVQPVEAELVADQLNRMPQKLREETLVRIAENADLEQLGVDDYIRAKTPCAFLNLKSRMCRIYEIRPMACRGYDSQDVRMCIDAISEPDKGTPRTLELIQLSTNMNIAITAMLEHFAASSNMMPLHSAVLRYA